MSDSDGYVDFEDNQVEETWVSNKKMRNALWQAIKDGSTECSTTSCLLRNQHCSNTVGAVISEEMHVKFVVKQYEYVMKKMYKSVFKTLPNPPKFSFKKPTKRNEVIIYDNYIKKLGLDVSKGMVSASNLYTYIIHHGLALVAGYEDIGVVLPIIRSLNCITTLHGDLIDDCSKFLIGNLISMINADCTWKHKCIEDGFVSSNLFVPKQFTPHLYNGPKAICLHRHQEEFLKIICEDDVKYICLDWDTGSGKSVVAAATSQAFTDRVVVHCTQPLLIPPAASVLWGAGIPFAIYQNGVVMYSPTCEYSRVVKNSKVIVNLRNPPWIIIADWQSISLKSKDPVQIKRALWYSKDIILMLDDLPLAQVLRACTKEFNPIGLGECNVVSTVFMTATLCSEIKKCVGESLKVLSHSTIYGFVDIVHGDEMITPLHGGDDVLERLKQLSGWRRRFLSPNAMKVLYSGVKNLPIYFNIGDLTNNGFVEYFIKLIEKTLTTCPKWPVKDQTYRFKESNGSGLGMIIVDDSDDLTEEWYTSLYGSTEWREQHNTSLDVEFKRVSKLASLKKRGNMFVSDWEVIASCPTNKLPQPETLISDDELKVGIKSLCSKSGSYSYSKDTFTVESYDEPQSDTDLRVSGFAKLSVLTPVTASNIKQLVAMGKVPFLNIQVDHINGHNLDCSALYLNELLSKDAMIQAVGRIGRLHHRNAGKLLCSSGDVFKMLL